MLRKMTAAKAARHPITMPTIVPVRVDSDLDEEVGVVLLLELESVGDAECGNVAAAPWVWLGPEADVLDAELELADVALPTPLLMAKSLVVLQLPSCLIWKYNLLSGSSEDASSSLATPMCGRLKECMNMAYVVCSMRNVVPR